MGTNNHYQMIFSKIIITYRALFVVMTILAVGAGRPKGECPTSTLYIPQAVNNTVGSNHINQLIPSNDPLGSEKICKFGVCIGDTVVNTATLYSDKALTNQIALWTSEWTYTM